MEYAALFLILGILGAALIRLLVLPVKLAVKLALHAGAGFLCLWLLNTVAPFTGIAIPVNWVTVLTAGFLGLPGVGVLALLQMA